MSNSNNEFELYEKLRAYQLHVQRMENQNVQVPTHQAYSPKIPNLGKAKQYHKYKKYKAIQDDNMKIMDKLVKINARKANNYGLGSSSSPNLGLPPIKAKRFEIPEYQEENGIIAKKIITSKPSIRTSQQLKEYRSQETHKKRLRKYQSTNGIVINRKDYIANLLLLKKMKSSRILNPQI